MPNELIWKEEIVRELIEATKFNNLKWSRKEKTVTAKYKGHLIEIKHSPTENDYDCPSSYYLSIDGEHLYNGAYKPLGHLAEYLFDNNCI